MEYLLRLEFTEEKEPYLLDVSSMLYDLGLAHDLSVLLSQPEYESYRFTRYFWFRNNRPIKRSHRIRTVRISKQSPLLLEVVIPMLGAILILIQIFEKVSNWKLNREKLELEVKKLRAEEQARKDQMIERYAEQLDAYLDERDAQKIGERIIQRFEKNPILLTDLHIKTRESSPKEHSED